MDEVVPTSLASRDAANKPAGVLDAPAVRTTPTSRAGSSDAHAARVCLVYAPNLQPLYKTDYWLHKFTASFAASGNVELTVIAPANGQTGSVRRLLNGSAGLPLINVQEVAADSEAGALREMLKRLGTLDAARSQDVVLVVGYQACLAVAENKNLSGRLWFCTPDLPVAWLQSAEAGSRLGELAGACRFWILETEAARAALEEGVSAVGRKTIVLPPCARATPQPKAGQRDTEKKSLAVYFDALSTDFDAIMADCRRLAELGEPIGAAHAVILGAGRLSIRQRRKLVDLAAGGDGYLTVSFCPESGPAVEPGRDADILCWNAPLVGDGTPVLEWPLETCLSVAAGRRLMLFRRTAACQSVLGEGVEPLLFDGFAELISACGRYASDAAAYGAAVGCLVHLLDDAAVREAARHRLALMLQRTHRGGLQVAAIAQRPIRLLIAGHDLKFFTQIQDHFERLPNVEVRCDVWAGLNKHDEAQSRELLEWADVIHCEWCLGNAIWYGQHKRPGQRLVVRFHAFEERTEYPPRVDVDAVDRFVFVGDHKRTNAVRRLGWPEEKTVVVPNAVDDLQFDRPKAPEARFTLGILGIVPGLKNLGTCLDVLERLRARDRRFRLRVKSRMPWEFPWVWGRGYERLPYEECFRRANEADLLRGAVAFDPHDERVAGWLQHIGFILSPSSSESFHLAVAEGMIGGAVPLVWNWGGAETIFGTRWLVSSADEAADRIWSWVHSGGLSLEQRRAIAYGCERFALDTVLDALRPAILGVADSTPAAGEVG